MPPADLTTCEEHLGALSIYASAVVPGSTMSGEELLGAGSCDPDVGASPAGTPCRSCLSPGTAGCAGTLAC